MRFFNLALAIAFAGVAAISSAQKLESQAARARDFASKAYMAAHPEAKTLPDRVLVRFDQKISPSEKAVVRAAAKGLLMRQYKIVSGLELIDSPLGADKAMEILKKNPHVISVEPDWVAHTSVTPNDPMFGIMWGLNQGNDVDVNAPEAWDTFTGNQEFLVADFDTGIDYTHPDLVDNVWTNPGEIPGNGIDDDGNGYIDDVHGYDFVNNDGDPADDHSHGTHTAGTIGARGNNATGVTGVNWKCRIVSIKTFDSHGSGSDADILAGMQYLAQCGAKVSNHSWGGGDTKDGQTWPAFYAACQALGAQGHLMVCAAGNNAIDNDASTFANIPASYNLPNIISVAAIDSAGAKANFSAYGLTSCDLAAPGVSVESTIPVAFGSYASFSGTSMATPHVTGGAALLWAYHPGLDFNDIKSRIVGHTKPEASMAGLCVSGGMLDLAQIIVNATPFADAGTDQTYEATGPLTSITLHGGGNDPDKDQFGYDWSEGGTSFSSVQNPSFQKPLGSFTFDLVVTDAHGAASTSSTTHVSVVDTTDPVFPTPADVTATPTSAAGAIVNFTTPVAYDVVDGAITGTAVPATGSTFAPGVTTVNVSATDLSSNTGHTSFKVTVTYGWSGFLSPFPKQQFKSGSTIPVKFMLTGASAGISNLSATGSWATVIGGIVGPDHPIGAFKYDPASHNYVLNWSTKGLAKGTYRIFANFGDGSVRSVDVVIK